MGKTTRELRRRVGEHLGDIRNRRDTAVARHVWQHHNGDATNLQFKGIEQVQWTKRRGDIDKRILQRETFWTFTLKTVVPEGLNEQLQFGCYI